MEELGIGPVYDVSWTRWAGVVFNLSELSEKDIQEVWHDSGEVRLSSEEDFEDLKYSWDAPLYGENFFSPISF